MEAMEEEGLPRHPPPPPGSIAGNRCVCKALHACVLMELSRSKHRSLQLDAAAGIWVRVGALSPYGDTVKPGEVSTGRRNWQSIHSRQWPVASSQ
jgi:hypothetical protein